MWPPDAVESRIASLSTADGVAEAQGHLVTKPLLRLVSATPPIAGTIGDVTHQVAMRRPPSFERSSSFGYRTWSH